jgi:hypothetical protein
MASRKHSTRIVNPATGIDHEAGHPCSRIPAEFCDGSRVAWLEDGSSRREPALTSRPFCDPCRSRILACLEELPSAYGRLQDALGDPPKTGDLIRAPFGPTENIRPEVDALMRVISVILHGWEARVRGSRLRLTQRTAPILAAESVKVAAETIGKNIDVLLALQDGWMSRTYAIPLEKPGDAAGWTERCRHCGRRISLSEVSGWWFLAEQATGRENDCDHDPLETTGPVPPVVIPDEILAVIGGREILRKGDGWIKVMDELGGAAAGNEILTLQWRARRMLGETKAQPESFDGIPCRACESMALERAEPPSDPKLPANHSKCPDCGDEMDRDTFAQWADTYVSWARGAGIRKCRRCSLAEPRHDECCWHACSCDETDHPRRRAAA